MFDPAYIVALIGFGLVACYLSTLLHELGHVLCAWLAGAVPTSFGLGMGRVYFVRSVWGIRFYLGARGSMSGLCFALFPQLLPGRCEMITYYSGGIVANSIVAALAFTAAIRWPTERAALFGYALGGVNLLIALLAAIPYSTRVGSAVQRSDGCLILLSWLRRSVSAPADELRLAECMSVLLQEIGDLRSLRANIVQAADTWCDLGDASRARELLDKAAAIPVDPLPPYRAFETLIRASAASAAGDLERADTFCREAEQDFLQLNHPNGLLISAIVRAGLLRKRGNPEDLAAYYGQLATNPEIRRVWPGSHLHRRLLTCVRANLEAGGTEAIVAAYEVTPACLRSPLHDLQTYRSAAREFARGARHQLAASAYARALEAIAALDETFAGADRVRFRLAQAGLIGEARASLRSIGREELAARLDSFFPSRSQIEQLEVAAREKQHQLTGWLLRWGLLTVLLNLAVIATALAIVPPRLPGDGTFEATADTFTSFGRRAEDLFGSGPVIFGLLLAFCTGCAVVFGLPVALASRWVTALRWLGAFLVLMFSAIPWLLCPMVFCLLALRGLF
jgi:hypothetical protein